MTPEHHKRGGASIGVLSKLSPWEAELIINLRLWCDGPVGQKLVWDSFHDTLPQAEASAEMRAFENLVHLIATKGHRPMVRHQVTCNCVGADECVFAHLVATASDGHLGDASLIATLMVRAVHAEHTAILAAQVGCCAKKIASSYRTNDTTTNVVPLH